METSCCERPTKSRLSQGHIRVLDQSTQHEMIIWARKLLPLIWTGWGLNVIILIARISWQWIQWSKNTSNDLWENRICIYHTVALVPSPFPPPLSPPPKLPHINMLWMPKDDWLKQMDIVSISFNFTQCCWHIYALYLMMQIRSAEGLFGTVKVW